MLYYLQFSFSFAIASAPNCGYNGTMISTMVRKPRVAKKAKNYVTILTVGQWEDGRLYVLPDPDFFLSYRHEAERVQMDTLTEAAWAIEQRQCAHLYSHDLAPGTWFATIFVNDQGEIIPHITLSPTHHDVTAALEAIVALLPLAPLA